jgi:hypothetical protein
MPYTDYSPTHPVSSGASLGTLMTNVRTNLLAMRDAIIAGTGWFPGWNMAAYDSGDTTPPASDADKPAYLVYSKGTERVKLTITWGISGATDGWPTRLVASYSSNSGTDYDVIKGGATNGYFDITYDASGYVTSAAWS